MHPVGAGRGGRGLPSLERYKARRREQQQVEQERRELQRLQLDIQRERLLEQRAAAHHGMPAELSASNASPMPVAAATPGHSAQMFIQHQAAAAAAAGMVAASTLMQGLQGVPVSLWAAVPPTAAPAAPAAAPWPASSSTASSSSAAFVAGPTAPSADRAFPGDFAGEDSTQKIPVIGDYVAKKHCPPWRQHVSVEVCKEPIGKTGLPQRLPPEIPGPATPPGTRSRSPPSKVPAPATPRGVWVDTEEEEEGPAFKPRLRTPPRSHGDERTAGTRPSRKTQDQSRPWRKGWPPYRVCYECGARAYKRKGWCANPACVLYQHRTGETA